MNATQRVIVQRLQVAVRLGAHRGRPDGARGNERDLAKVVPFAANVHHGLQVGPHQYLAHAGRDKKHAVPPLPPPNDVVPREKHGVPQLAHDPHHAGQRHAREEGHAGQHFAEQIEQHLLGEGLRQPPDELLSVQALVQVPLVVVILEDAPPQRLRDLEAFHMHLHLLNTVQVPGDRHSTGEVCRGVEVMGCWGYTRIVQRLFVSGHIGGHIKGKFF